SLSLQLSGGVLPGTVDFYKFQFSNAWYKSLYKDLTLLVSSRFGYLGKFNESDYTPYINYFYMGGSGLSPLPTVQLRGYEDRTIGVFDPSINLYTGNVYTKFNAELRYPITLNPTASVWVLAFAEAGNLWARPRDVNLGDLKRSAGLGIRVLLPILGAPIGLDYGYGFDAVPANPTRRQQGWVFTFSFGQFAQ
ncbi:MAG: BamA/TamA family outer membrane protein, partial [Rhizobacter sp.]|nr:BamA/TamA family outer membrane protein [Chlorobiales bacterium]